MEILLDFSCIICGGSAAGYRDLKDAKTSKPIRIACCQTCGTVQIAQMPTDDELSEFYSIAYREEYKNISQPKPKHIYRAGKMAAERLQKMKPFLQPGSSLLDVGAGGGEFTYLATASGLKASGIDPNIGYLEFGRDEYQVSLEVKELSDISKKKKFNTITLFHVFEHLAQPRDVIEKMYGILNDGGHLVIEVPNLESKRTSPMNHFFAAHLAYYTSLSLTALLEEYFEIKFLENSDILFVVGKKLPKPATKEWSKVKTKSVELGSQRLRNKALPEYLMNGGLFSAFKAIPKYFDEKRGSEGLQPKAILDKVKNSFQT
jgi:2-polyprenyl-3-methyl-5-hydroxy-6-metoxy-1,4-benzoquinol methylase